MVLRSRIQDQGPRSHANIQAVQCKFFNIFFIVSGMKFFNLMVSVRITKDASLCNSSVLDCTSAKGK